VTDRHLHRHHGQPNTYAYGDRDSYCYTDSNRNAYGYCDRDTYSEAHADAEV
jgi:hypothetical protein